MSNILTYTLTLQDQISAKMQKIGITSDSALDIFSRLQKQSVALSKVMGDTGRSVGTLQMKLDMLRRERDWIPEKNISDIRRYNTEINKLERQINHLQTTSKRSFKNMFSQAFNSMPFGSFLTNPLVAAGALAAGSFRVGFQNDMAGVAFETLLGDPQKSKKLVDQIRSYANLTPYNNMPLQENAKMMLGFGIAQDKILPNLKMIGDVAMGDANKMNLLTLAFSQISSAGKLQGQDLLQLINAGFNPLQEISKNTGKSMAVLRKEMEKGNISFDTVNKAFISATSSGGRFFNMTQKMSESPMGKWSTLLDALQNTLLKVYDILRPMVIPALNLLTSIVGGLQIVMQYVIYRFQRFRELLDEGNVWAIILTAGVAGITGAMILQSLWSGIVAAKTAIWTGAQWLLNAALTANPVVLIIAGILALIAIIAYVVYKTDGWGKQWQSVVNFMKYTFEAYVESIKLYWNTVVNSFMMGLDIIKLGWYKFKEVVGLGNSSENQSAIARINADVEARQKVIVDGAKKVAELQRKAFESLKWELSWNSDRKLSSILPAGLPGFPKTDNPTTPPPVKHITDAISAGGTRNSTIQITFKNMVESIVFDGTLGEKRGDLEKEVTSIMARILAMAQSTA